MEAARRAFASAMAVFITFMILNENDAYLKESAEFATDRELVV